MLNLLIQTGVHTKGNERLNGVLAIRGRIGLNKKPN